MRSFQQKIVRRKDCSISTLKYIYIYIDVYMHMCMYVYVYITYTHMKYKSMQYIPGIVRCDDTLAQSLESRDK